MPRIEDIAKIWEPWSSLEDNLKVRGYKPGAISIDESVADRRSALFITCPECDHHCIYVGFNKDMKSYRSYAVCYLCDTATRLS